MSITLKLTLSVAKLERWIAARARLRKVDFADENSIQVALNEYLRTSPFGIERTKAHIKKCDIAKDGARTIVLVVAGDGEDFYDTYRYLERLVAN
jgi:hypothetical protein